jgi:hypothetical protein
LQRKREGVYPSTVTIMIKIYDVPVPFDEAISQWGWKPNRGEKVLIDREFRDGEAYDAYLTGNYTKSIPIQYEVDCCHPDHKSGAFVNSFVTTVPRAEIFVYLPAFMFNPKDFSMGETFAIHLYLAHTKYEEEKVKALKERYSSL